jgi:hypothetical protein
MEVRRQVLLEQVCPISDSMETASALMPGPAALLSRVHIEPQTGEMAPPGWALAELRAGGRAVALRRAEARSSETGKRMERLP